MTDTSANVCCGETAESITQHEINYMPSYWNKRYDREELVARFDSFCEKVTKKARESFKCELDIPYGNTERTKYDIYGTDLPKDAPVLVFIHGGYWQEFSKNSAGFAVPGFVENGVKVILIGYDLCPTVTVSDIVAEIKVAVEQSLKYAVDNGSRCVWIAGHSVGAQLAASLLHDRPWLDKMTRKGYSEVMKGICLIAGLYNLKPLLTVSVNENLKLTDKVIKENSFLTMDTSEYAPIKRLKVISVIGDCDAPPLFNESREYAQKIMTFVDNVEYIQLRDIDHYNIVENLVEKDFVLTKLLLREINAPLYENE